MSVRNTNLGGATNWSDGDILYSADLNDTFNATVTQIYADNTGGSIGNSTTETDLATITVSQNDLNDNGTLIINAGVWGGSGDGTGNGSTMRLYIGGVLKKTVTLTGNATDRLGSSINYVETGVDSTAGDVIVKISGQNSSADADRTSNVTGLTVLGYNR